MANGNRVALLQALSGRRQQSQNPLALAMQQRLRLQPSPSRNQVLAQVLAGGRTPGGSGSFAESASIAANKIIPALFERRRQREADEAAAERQQLVEELLGVPQPGQVGLADPRTGEVQERTVPRRLSPQDERTRAIAALLAQTPGGATNVASSLLAQQLAPQERDIREGRPGEFIDFTDPSNPQIVREPPSQPSRPIGNVNPSDFTPESVAEFQRTGDFSKLRRAEDAAGAGVEELGQFNVKGVGESTVFRTAKGRPFIVDEKGKRKFVASSDLTEIRSVTPNEFQRLENQLADLRAKENLTEQDKERIKRIEDRLTSITTPSISDIVSPVFRKLRSGEELTQAERNTLDQFLKLSTTDIMTRRAIGIGQSGGEGTGELVRDEDGIFRLR